MAANYEPELTLESIEHEEDGRCVICQFDFKSGENLQRIRICSHVFHTHCLEKWLHSKDHCPLCRTILTEDGKTYIKREGSPSSEINIIVSSSSSPETETFRVTFTPRPLHDRITQSPRPNFNPSVDGLNARNLSYRRRLNMFDNPAPADSLVNISFAAILSNENSEESPGPDSPGSMTTDELSGSDSTESSASVNEHNNDYCDDPILSNENFELCGSDSLASIATDVFLDESFMDVPYHTFDELCPIP